MMAIDRGLILSDGALGAGKSEPGAAKLVQWALKHPRRADGRPTKFYVIGPDFSLIRQEQFGKILEHLRRIEKPGFDALVKRVVGGQDPRIILCHDQVLLGRSAKDPERLRGHEVDGFWGDEIQKWSEKAFRIAFSRIRSASATRVVLTGSPEDVPGFVWRMLSGEDEKYNNVRAQLLRSGSGFYAFRWHSGQNTSNTEGVLGDVRAILDASAAGGVAAQELEGRFPGTAEAPSVSLIDYSRAFYSEISLTPQEAQPFSLGVDIGETDDFTWLTVLSARGVVLRMERFNAGSPGVPRRTFYPYTEARIAALARTWRVRKVVIDIAKAGKPMHQTIEAVLRGAVEVIAYDTGVSRRKSEVIESLALGLSRGDCRIPAKWRVPSLEGQAGQSQFREVDHVPQLRKEFEEMVPNENSESRRVWDHPRGGHDDGVVSLALAFFALGPGSHGPSSGPTVPHRKPPRSYPGLDAQRPS